MDCSTHDGLHAGLTWWRRLVNFFTAELALPTGHNLMVAAPFADPEVSEGDHRGGLGFRIGSQKQANAREPLQ